MNAYDAHCIPYLIFSLLIRAAHTISLWGCMWISVDADISYRAIQLLPRYGISFSIIVMRWKYSNHTHYVLAPATLSLCLCLCLYVNRWFPIAFSLFAPCVCMCVCAYIFCSLRFWLVFLIHLLWTIRVYRSNVDPNYISSFTPQNGYILLLKCVFFHCVHRLNIVPLFKT